MDKNCPCEKIFHLLRHLDQKEMEVGSWKLEVRVLRSPLSACQHLSVSVFAFQVILPSLPSLQSPFPLVMVPLAPLCHILPERHREPDVSHRRNR
jgi:hypothetical protein